MGTIHYKTGDATRPEGDGAKIICHVCNDIGGWGRGFVTALSARWRMPEKQFRGWHGGAATHGPFELGAVQFVPVEQDITVANMIGQHGIHRGVDGSPPVRYEAIRAALAQVAEFANEHQASVHMPRIGAGLAGGDWRVIEGIIVEELCNRAVSVTVYDLPVRE
jgi:O-acetyl-ADP-ribose deacetylase (regulator of RNase III)